MATRPAFQFYPADWRNNANLRRCSEAARGAWIDVLCLMHDSDEYGVLRWPLADIAQAAGLPIKLLHELSRKGVLKGADSGADDYRWAPFHAGKQGDLVTLVAAGEGPCWYCSRFVKDEFIRHRRGAKTRFTTDNQPPKTEPKSTPTRPVGVRQGDGASASSSTSSTEQEQKLRAGASARGSRLPADWTLPADLREWARAERPELDADREAAKFADHWRAQPGAKGRKTDWPATWRNWIRNAYGPRAAPATGKPSAAADFRGKSYASTPIDQLPPDLRAAAERAMRDD